MTLNHESGSQDIAAYYADLRSGDMAQCDEPSPRGIGFGWLTAWAFAFLVAGMIGGYFFGEVPEYYEPPRGQGACLTKAC